MAECVQGNEYEYVRNFCGLSSSVCPQTLAVANGNKATDWSQVSRYQMVGVIVVVRAFGV